MNYVVAVSGGVDSVVLLDMLVAAGEHDVVVAHFDHGIRQESDRDAAFVVELARRYGLRSYSERAELGPGASEALARIKRYEFLRTIAATENATIVTAHHADDVVETIAINLIRGTGWRGLAVMGDSTVQRPLIDLRKHELYEYAVRKNLEWVEDETNLTDAYLRNRVRANLSGLSGAARQELMDLWRKQQGNAQAIDEESAQLNGTSRYFLTMIDEQSALEILRYDLLEQGLTLTRPQRVRLLHAIKVARAGTTYEAGPGTIVGFTAREFIVKHPL